MDLHFDENDNLSLKRFEKMLKTDSVYFFDSAEFERIIHYYIDNGKNNLAKKAIALGLEQHPDTVGLRLLKAELYILEENFEEALVLLNEVEALEPGNEEMYIQKAMLLSKQEQHHEAINLLNKALEIQEETTVDVLSLIAMEFLFLEDFERAILYFRNCLEIDSQDITILHNVVYCYDMLDQHQEAVEFLNQYIEGDPYNEAAWHQLGRQYRLLNQHDAALNAFDYAILIDDQFVGAYFEKAATLEHLKRYEEAIANLLITTELEDPSAITFLKIASCYEKLNKKETATIYYLKSNEHDPFLDKPLIALANLHYKHEEYQKSLFYINKLITIDDENPAYWKIYAQSNLKIAFFEEAAKAFQKCLDLDDNSLDVHLSLADSHFFSGNYKEAVKVLLNAEVYYHRLADIEYRLSGLYFMANSPTLGVKYLQSALHINSQKYKVFQRLFPVVHHSAQVRMILENFRNSRLL